MSTDPQDTTSSVPDPTADASDTDTPSEDNVEISESELNELAEFLTAIRALLISHEGRLAELEKKVAPPKVVLGKANSIKEIK